MERETSSFFPNPLKYYQTVNWWQVPPDLIKASTFVFISVTLLSIEKAIALTSCLNCFSELHNLGLWENLGPGTFLRSQFELLVNSIVGHF